MKKIIYIIISIVVVISCKTNNQSVGIYHSYYKESKQYSYINGPVKESRTFFKYLYPKDTIKETELYVSLFRIKTLTGSRGLQKYDDKGIILKHQTLIDSLMQTLPNDTVRVKGKTRRGYAYIYIRDLMIV